MRAGKRHPSAKAKVRKKRATRRRKEADVTATPVAATGGEDRYDPWPHLQVGYRGPWPRLPRVQPPDSDIWPPEYRGERWKRIYGTLFAGKCLLCQYSFPQPESRQMRDRWRRDSTPLLCTNHAARPGELIEVRQCDTCRNFKPKCWWSVRREKQPAATVPELCPPKRKKGVRRVPLSQGLFATIDAADYAEICQYTWSASRHGNKVYAQARINGKYVLMHRFLMRPRKGYVVDHLDGNSLNNCRGNLCICTAAQNGVNRRPRGGSSRFVGVSRCGARWRAGITHRGKTYPLGYHATAVEAARVRDHKAVELCGVHAYLNFPQEWRFDRNGVGHPVRTTRRQRRR